MTRLVTIFGGSGFIGRSLVQHLARRGWRVRVAVRRPGQARSLQPLGDVGQITPIPAKVQDPATVGAAIEGADAVVNLTGLLYEKGAQTFEAVHVQGAANIARVAAAAKVNALVQMSALGADAASTSSYASSKGRGEESVRQIFATASIVRPSIVFGPDDDFFNRFARMALISPALPLIGGGTTRFQPVFVGDVAEAIACCLSDPGTAGRTYELGGPGIYTFRELLTLMLREIGRRRLLVPISYDLATLQAALFEWLPVPPLTRDQVELLKHDNVVSEGALTLQDLGITPASLELILPTYMDCYRRGGRYLAPRADDTQSRV
jgi:NADH dehydrogenase